MSNDPQRVAWRAFRAALCAWICAAAVSAQVKIQGAGVAGGLLLPNDLAALESPQPRNDLQCTAFPVKPVLGFDLRFRVRYQVEVPLAEISQSAYVTVLFRVTPRDRRDGVAFFSRRYDVPEIDSGAKGRAHVEGEVELGSGAYRMDWLMRDARERVCRFSWDLNASLPGRARALHLDLPPGAAEADEEDPFQPAAFSGGQPEQPAASIKVLVNLEPMEEGAVTPEPEVLEGVASVLRTIGRDPHFGRFSVVVYSGQGQEVFYRRENASEIDFAALSETVRSLRLGTIDINKLAGGGNGGGFLSDLLNAELLTGNRPDVALFIGPRAQSTPNISLPEGTDTGREMQLFDLAYVPDPTANPWRDSIGKLVKARNGREYLISQPLDLANACQDILARVTKSRVETDASRSRQLAAGR